MAETIIILRFLESFCFHLLFFHFVFQFFQFYPVVFPVFVQLFPSFSQFFPVLHVSSFFSAFFSFYSQLDMRYIQWSTHFSTHVEHERTECKTPRLQPAHTQGLALCHRVILDSVTLPWVQAGHPQNTGARTREGRGWPDSNSTT